MGQGLTLSRVHNKYGLHAKEPLVLEPLHPKTQSPHARSPTSVARFN